MEKNIEKSMPIKKEIKNDGECPQIVEEIIIEELSIDGICGVY